MKYIDIESNTREKLDHFLTELPNTDFITKLNQNPYSKPNKNYDSFINILTDIKQSADSMSERYICFLTQQTTIMLNIIPIPAM